MEFVTRKTVLLGCALAALTVGAGAQQASSSTASDQQDQYQGQSNPPADDAITTAPQPKPSPSVPMTAPAPAPAPAPVAASAPAPAAPVNAAQSTDDGIVQVAEPNPQPNYPQQAPQPGLVSRGAMNDPDGDIVHPSPLPPGTLEEGTQIRVKLLTELSSSRSVKGDAFRGRVDTDVLQDGQVLIPAGAEIAGKVVEASGGRFGGHGTLRLRPETVILPNGAQFMLVARVLDTENSRTKVDREGTIEAGPRYKRDGIEYGGGVAVGAVTGAVVGGPVGALAGGLIGAGAVTVHLMMDHPQATLEPGSTLLFRLSDRLSLVASNSTGN